MKTIKKEISKEFIIQKSKFITKIYPINSLEEINDILDKLHDKYKDATHICYCYILNNTKRANDDGEPGGTAGMPMLHVLEQKELTSILAVIIRYFGGIKLGASGLVRAYSNCLSETIENDLIVEMIPGIIVNLTYDYSASKQIDNLLQSQTILTKSFDEKINIKLKISIEDYNEIRELLQQLCFSIIEKERLFIY